MSIPGRSQLPNTLRRMRWRDLTEMIAHLAKNNEDYYQATVDR